MATHYGPKRNLPLITATGGTETDVAVNGIIYRVHTFTESGTFTVTDIADIDAAYVEHLVVGGGGGGGNGRGSFPQSGGGGGAGGFRKYVRGENYNTEPANVTVGAYSVVVGDGGIGKTAASVSDGTSGTDSSFSNVVSAGGGRGGGRLQSPEAGGSGGGHQFIAEEGNTPTTVPSQGNKGGDGYTHPVYSHNSGGGGGAGKPGENADTEGNSGNGGDGLSTAISGAFTYYAGGGGGGQSRRDDYEIRTVGTGGVGGGGDAVGALSGTAFPGDPNTGGGGGGAWTAGGAGGSGIVIIRYPIAYE